MLSSPMRQIGFYLGSCILFAQGVGAIDLGDRAPEPDIGLSYDEPVAPKEELPEVSFALQEGAPDIDGTVSDPFWQRAQTFSLSVELFPSRLAPAQVDTDAWMGLTPTHLYVAFFAHDDDPSQLRSARKEPDSTRDDDYVSLVIDPAGLGAKKLEFRVSPHGTMSDVFQDTISDRYLYDWGTEWEAAASITTNGYAVEMAIPLTSLRFSGLKAGAKPGIALLKRAYPRRVDSTTGYFFRYALELPEAVQEKQSLLAELVPGFPVEEALRLSLRHRVQVTPHAVYHFDEEREVAGSFQQVDDHPEWSGGFDLEYSLDRGQALNLTVKPNFLEVETDVVRDSINNSFIPFQPEKRAFFQDVGEAFATLTKVVYTRNIIEPEIGASFMGSGTGHSAGGFWVKDLQTEVIVPDNLGNDTVELLSSSESAAVHYQVPQGRNLHGIHSTYRSGSGYRNGVVGLDGLLNLGIDDKVRYQVMVSETDYPRSFREDVQDDPGVDEEEPGNCTLGKCSLNAAALRADPDRTLRGHGLRINYKHDSPQNLYWLNYYDVASDFRADLGFVRQVDLRGGNIAYGRNWYLNTFSGDNAASRIRVYGVAAHFRSYEENEPFDTNYSVFGEFRGSFQTVARIGYTFAEKAVNRVDQSSLSLEDNAPLFDEHVFRYNLEMSPIRNFTVGCDGRYGDTANADNLVLGRLTELKPRLIWNLLDGAFEIGAFATFRDFDVDEGRLFDEQFLTLRAVFRQSDKLSHRIAWLDDLTRRDVELWLDEESPRDRDRFFEYTFTFAAREGLRFITGCKFGDEYDAELDETDLTTREAYVKVEYDF